MLLIGWLLVGLGGCGGGSEGAGEDDQGGGGSATAAPSGIVAIEVASGNRTVLATVIDPRAAVLGPGGSHLLVWDATARAILRIELADGSRQTVADASTGNGPALENVRTLGLDAGGNRLVLYDNTVLQGLLLIAVNLTSGNRTVLADRFTGPGPTLDAPVSIAVQTTSRAFVSDAAADAVYVVNLAGGGRSILSDATNGTGPIWRSPGQVRYAPGVNRLVVLDPVGNALFAVDTPTGNRTLLSDGTSGIGPAIEAPAGLGLAASAVTGYVVQHLPTRDFLLAVDLLTGARTVLSSDARGMGPDLGFPAAAVLGPAGATIYVLNRRFP